MAAKFSWSNYWKPTPKKIRLVGVLIASLGTLFGTGTAIYSYLEVAAQTNPKLKAWLTVVAVAGPALGWLGKEFTNFFATIYEDPEA